MFNLVKKIFGTAQTRQLKKISKIVSIVNSWDKKFASFSDDEFISKTNELKKRYQEGVSLDDLLPEAYGLVKAVCRKLCGSDVHVSGYDQKWDMVPYDVQILGAIAMHRGCIAEMQTGEGKTLTAAMPLYLNALSGQPVHLVTVNDYLAKRDCQWIGTIFKKLGLTVSYLTNDIPPHERKEVYSHDIVYGTASEFGFDYLRDNSMASRKEELVQNGYFFAIVDEIDSILIDEARTPLIISGPATDSKQMYNDLKDGVSSIVRIQKAFCNKLASDARKTLDDIGLLHSSDTPETIKLTKEQEEKKLDAFKKLWLVSKGTPRNKTLKKIKENPDLRAEIEKLETYYYSEHNKEEKFKELASLYIIIDEKASEFELTDKGINEWTKYTENSSYNDFVMLDLGYEYSKIDNDETLSSEEKISKKTELREEDSHRKERSHNLRQLFRAHLLMEKDVDYIVVDNKIVIIDENTGRPQPGRRFSDGLHQSIEAKENVAIQKETQTYATITLQNYFRMYEKIAGMSGTAITEANEFKEIYKLQVLEIPTYMPCKRKDQDDKIYMTEREKYAAILREIKEAHEKGQPILIGSESVEISEKLSRILKQNNLPHTILNAKNHSKEAEIIAEAGKKGVITLSTNMAGRGTDIKLKDDVKELGGLLVIGTTRHHSRRIDRQLRGRSGRLGDPGSSQFFVSFEDSLMRLFASPRLTMMLKKFRPPEGEAISAKVLNKSIETAQKRIEQRNYQIRKHTLEYDDVMNKQRSEIYSFRHELLTSEDPIAIAKEIIFNVCSIITEKYFLYSGKNKTISNGPSSSDIDSFIEELMSYFPVTFEKEVFQNALQNSGSKKIEEIENIASDKAIATFEEKIEHQKKVIIEANGGNDTEDSLDILKEVIRSLLIRKIDILWQQHLLAIDHLRSDVSLRAIGQKDPLVEFKHEAFYLFDLFSKKLQKESAKDLFLFEMISQEEKKLQDALANLKLTTQKSFVPQPGDENYSSISNENNNIEEATPITIRQEPKVGRNQLCQCGSGKKHKKCCGKNEIP